MKTCIAAVAFLLVACLTVATAEAKGTKTKKEKSIHGSIVSVAADGGSMVVKVKGKKGSGGTDETITINASTVIEIDGASGKKPADLSAGMTAKVEVSNNAASSITVKGKHKKKKA